MPYYQIFSVMKLYPFADNFLLLHKWEEYCLQLLVQGHWGPLPQFLEFCQFLSEFLTDEEAKVQEYHSE
jgi:hypothetical protein